MKAFFQAASGIDSAIPYRSDESIRTAPKGYYWEFEVPFPTNNRKGPPDFYMVMNLIRRDSTSVILANPEDGLQAFLKAIDKEKEYVSAFFKNWELYASLNAGEKVQAEIYQRPVLASVIDPDDQKEKYMVARMVSLPPNTGLNVTDEEFDALESLIVPTSRLHVEAEAALTRVGQAFVRGEFPFPLTKFEKFKKVFDAVLEFANMFRDAAEASNKNP